MSKRFSIYCKGAVDSWDHTHQSDTADEATVRRLFAASQGSEDEAEVIDNHTGKVVAVFKGCRPG